MRLRSRIDQLDNSLQRLLANREKFKMPIYYLLFSCIIAVSITLFTLSVGKPYMGIVLLKNDGVWTVVIEDNNGPASLAGIREGDRPLEINGQPANVFLEKYESAGVVLGRLIKEIITIDDDNQLISVDLEDTLVSRQYFTSQLAWLIVCIVFWLTGLYVFFKRPKNMAALILCLCGLSFGLALSGNMAVERTIPTAIWFEITASVIGPWLLLHFFLILPEERKWLRDNSLIYLIYIPATITLILFPIIGYADGQPLPGFRSVRYAECGIAFLAVIGVGMFNYFRAVSIRTRQQIKIVLGGCLFALVPLMILNMLPAAMHAQPVIPFGFSILFLVFIPLGMGYAVITKRLMDIDVIIRRGVIYGLITLVMAVIVSVAIYLVTIFHSSVGTPVQILTALGLGGVAAVLFGPIKKRVELLIDKLFYKDRYDYRQVIQSLSSALNSINNLTDISRLTVGTIVNTLNLMGGCLFIKTPSNSFEIMASQGIFSDITKQEYLKTLVSSKNKLIEYPNLATDIDPNVTLIVRLVTGEQEVGILYLSHKVSKQNFSADDLYLIQGISSVSSMALHSAMLVRDVSTRDTFVSIASHELRTPLTAIVGYTDLLLRRNPPEATRKKWLKTILENGQSINAMTNDLLNVTHIQSGKIALKLERLRLFQILDEQVNMAIEKTDKHKFFVDIDPDLPDVIIDRGKFSQVIANLLSNAINYSPNGGCITLSSRYNASQNCVVVSVTDEGIGISSEDTKSLFSTFHRIQRPETQNIRGSGLGLFIAKEWTEAMGGKIWVESELNKGSTFFVSIPIQREEGSLERVI